MAFNNGYPASYSFQQGYPIYQGYQQPVQPVTQPIQGQMQAQQNDSTIMFVNGIDEANSWVVQPGKSAFLMDRNANCFYVKSVDHNGMPNPIEIYDYKKREAEKEQGQYQQTNRQPQIDTDMFVTREEFEERIAQLMPKKQTRRTSKKEVEDGESDV